MSGFFERIKKINFEEIGRMIYELSEDFMATESADKSLFRRTDAQLAQDRFDEDRAPESFQYQYQIPLSIACSCAESHPGVYILYLDGKIMKCGRAAYSQGVAWRLRQYYNLNYDAEAQKGNTRSVNQENRDRVMVSWQCCPVSKCKELEYKLFQKYGEGPWAMRSPEGPEEDSWRLLI